MFRLLTAVATTLAPFTVNARAGSSSCNSGSRFSTLVATRILTRGGGGIAASVNDARKFGADTLVPTTFINNHLVASPISIRGGSSSSSSSTTTTEYETLSTPAPGSPFHYAFPVHNLDAAKDFYGKSLPFAPQN